MRRWLTASLLVGALGCGATSARVSVDLATGPAPAQLRISAYDRFGPLLLDDNKMSALPTAFTALLPDLSQHVRVVVDGGQVIGATGIDTQAHAQVSANVALAPPASDDAHLDSDGDGIPDTVDNCPRVANPDQRAMAGGPIGDACLGADPNAAAVWRPFNAASPWNTKIDAAPAIDPASDALITDFAASWPMAPVLYINISMYGTPVYLVDSSTPVVTVQLAPGGVGGQGFENGASVVPIPANATASMGGGLSLCLVDRTAKREWGMYGAIDGATGWTCKVGATADLAGSGVRPPNDGMQDFWQSIGAETCGYPLSAGLITVEELRSGRIEHALTIAYPHVRSRYYTPPASSSQATVTGVQPDVGIPCGGRIQLDPALDLTTLGLSPSGMAIARALQEYGAYVSGMSGGLILTADGSPDAQAEWSTGLLSNGEAKAVPLSRFRVLQLGMLYDGNN
jgi:hypothetical protein